MAYLFSCKKLIKQKSSCIGECKGGLTVKFCDLGDTEQDVWLTSHTLADLKLQFLKFRFHKGVKKLEMATGKQVQPLDRLPQEKCLGCKCENSSVLVL